MTDPNHIDQHELFAPHEAVVSPLGGVVVSEAVDDSELDASDLEAQAAFGDSLTKLGEHVEEVHQEAERITRGAAQLIEAYKVKPEFFDDRSRTTIFTSLALQAAKTQEALESGRGERRELERKQRFVANATFLLTREYADGFPELSKQHEAEIRGDHDAISKAKMDKFEQPELTASLRRHIEREGILDELKDRISVGGEDPQYHVLSVGRNASVYFDHAANGLEYKELREWSEGIERRSEAFAASIPGGELAANAAGFAINFSEDPGQHHVYIPAAPAEVLMAEERGIVPGDFALQGNRNERTTGTIRHEYVHTQGSLNVGGEFGKSLEERRAEYFSGETGEYFEVKTFFRHLQLINKGKFIGDIFDEALPGRNDESQPGTYELLAKHYGIEAVAEIAAAQPDAYIRHTTSAFTHDMLDSLGGCNEIVERMTRNLDAERAEDARTRTARVINNFRSEKVVDGQPDPDQEQFIGSYFAPVLHGLGLKLADIPYTPPAAA